MKVIVKTHELQLKVEGELETVLEFIADLEKIQYVVDVTQIIEGDDKLLTILEGIEEGEITVEDLMNLKVVGIREGPGKSYHVLTIEINGKQYEWIFLIFGKGEVKNVGK